MAVRRLAAIPLTLVTLLLIASFMMQSRATAIVHSLAPAVGSVFHVAGLLGTTSLTLVDGTQSHSSQIGQAARGSLNSTGSANGGGSGGTNPSSGQLGAAQSSVDQGHSVSTAGHTNCGRFGNGFHGGKHLFVCPNKPFPPPANH